MLQKGNFGGNMILQNDTSKNPNKSYKRAEMQDESFEIYIFRMESNNDSDNKKERIVEKSLNSDILRGLINAGYGANNKLLKYTEIKDLLKGYKYEENILDNIFNVEDMLMKVLMLMKL